MMWKSKAWLLVKIEERLQAQGLDGEVWTDGSMIHVSHQGNMHEFGDMDFSKWTNELREKMKPLFGMLPHDEVVKVVSDGIAMKLKLVPEPV